MTVTDQALAAAEAGFDAATARWMAWLRIPSVSAQPVHDGDCAAAARFCAADLESLGFQVTIRQTQGQPVVVAHHPGPGGDAAHLLYYGHYDVQPAEPLELWSSPPFEPTLVQGPHGARVVARGAVDDKGQVSMWLAAFRAWHDATGGMPVRITAVIEGEEEIGSPHLEAFVASHADELRADAVVISDTGMWDIDTPALTTSLRGMVYMEVILRGPSRDLHSGSFGGSALNPINALTAALGQLRDKAGRIRLAGFYDGIADVSPEQAAQWDGLGFSEARFLGEIGLHAAVGEVDRHPLERLWSRPTCDINGIWGGYQGPGSKTVIPAEAGAKVSFRLVPGQDPARVAEAFRAFMTAQVPGDARLEFKEFSSAPGIEVATESRFVTAAMEAMGDEFGRPAVMIGCGGSIPVVESFRRVLGIDSLLMGFGLNDDQTHGPNEKFEVACFRRGMRSHVRLLGKLAR